MNKPTREPVKKFVGHSVMTIKAVDTADKAAPRKITGTASTPNPDRVGDIVVPEGIKFNNPVPLLWQHDATRPIGLVKFKKPTKAGLDFEAEIMRFDEPPGLKARVDEAWASIESGMVTGVSIGFRALKYAWLDDGGIEFLETEVYELSVVTIPANADATIELVKSLDSLAPASGQPETIKTPPGTSGKPKSQTTIPKEGAVMSGKTLSAQITALTAAIATKSVRMDELAQGATDASRAMDDAEAEEFDTLTAEVTSLEGDVVRLKNLERIKLNAAKAVGAATGDEPAAAAPALRPATVPAQVRHVEKTDPGIAMARIARCIALAALSTMQGNPVSADGLAKNLYPNDERVVAALVHKANVVAASTGNAPYAGFLVGAETTAFADFVEYLRPQTIVGKFGAAGIPALRRVPFRVALLGQTAGAAGYWVGEGKPKPVTSFAGERTTLTPLKVANIAVVTMELLRDSSPAAAEIIRNELAAAIVARLDTDFVDPTKTASAGVSPASITNGAEAIASTGEDLDDIIRDVRAVMQKFIDANNAPTSGVWLMSPTNALALSMYLNPLGQVAFPGITMNGGIFWGMPVIVSNYVGDNVILVNASDIYFGDDGDIDIALSTEASLQMLDNPTNDSVTPTPTSLVSMFQTNSVAFRAERTVNWKRRRASAVAYLTDVEWGGPVPAS